MVKNLQEHDRIRREVLRRLDGNQLVLRYDKCKFGQTHVKFLDFITGD